MTDLELDMIQVFADCADKLMKLKHVEQLKVLKALEVFFSDPTYLLPLITKEHQKCPTTDSK